LKSTNRSRRDTPVLLAVLALLAACASSKVPASQKDPFYLYQMGVNHFQQGHLPEAERYFKDSLRLDPGNFATWNHLGLAQLLQGKSKEAETSFRKAIERNSSFADARHNLGVTYLQMGELAAAKEALVLAKQDTVFNQGPAVWRNLGLVEMRMGAPGEAVAYFNEALARDKDYAIALFDRGQAYEQMGEAEKAVADYRAYAEVRKDDPEALFHLGRALVNLRRPDEARPPLERVKLLTPAGPYGVEAAKLLAILP
jgi:Tfp pilus assembly protein PilF